MMRKSGSPLAFPFNTDVIEMTRSTPPSFANVCLRTHTMPSFSADIELEGKYGSVDLSRVISMDDLRDVGRSWGDLLGVGNRPSPLKRVQSLARELSRNPAYYVGRHRKLGWSFYEVQGEFYACQGLARTVLARFFLELNGLPPVVHGVDIASLSLSEWLSLQPDRRDSFEMPEYWTMEDFR